MAGDKNHQRRWWLTNRTICERYVRDARMLMATQTAADVAAALGVLEEALVTVPRMEAALEMKARCLLFLKRWREVAEMLKEYIPSYRAEGGEDDFDSFTSSDGCDVSRAKLLPDRGERSDGDGGFRCFSVVDLRRKVLAGLCRRSEEEEEGHWRYMMLGHACYHLGLMDDAMILLQTGRRLATAVLRHESTTISDDYFTFSTTSTTPPPPSQLQSETDSAISLLSHIKLLLRRRAAAQAALDASHPTEAIRHFSKILDGHRGTPHLFAVICLVGRATAHQEATRPVEAIADLNRALALEPAHIPALRARAHILEHVRALDHSLRDLDHLKLLYDSFLRKPTWRPNNDVSYSDVHVNLRTLTHRIQEIRLAVAANGGGSAVDYYRLMGVRRGCTRAELSRAHLLLCLRHKPDKAAAFIDRLEFVDDQRGVDTVKEQARMSALMLYRMLQKGHSSIMSTVMDDEAAVEWKRVREAKEAAAAALRAAGSVRQEMLPEFQGVFCRDVLAVGFRAIPVKYEGLSC